MGGCYSLDLRERISGFVENGGSRRAAARQFAVSASCAIKLARRRARTGSVAPARQGRPKGSGKLEPVADFLIAAVEATPDITMPELAERLVAEHGVTATPAMLSRFLCQRGFTYKKGDYVACKPDSLKLQFERRSPSYVRSQPAPVSLRGSRLFLA